MYISLKISRFLGLRTNSSHRTILAAEQCPACGRDEFSLPYSHKFENMAKRMDSKLSKMFGWVLVVAILGRYLA
jgi:hypothetical protein